MPPGRSAPSGHRAPAGQQPRGQPAAGELQVEERWEQPKRHPAAACAQTRAVARHRPEQGRSGSEKPRAVPQVREPSLQQAGPRAPALKERQAEPQAQEPPEQPGRRLPTAAACGQTREACFRPRAQQPRRQAGPHHQQARQRAASQPQAHSPPRPRPPSRPQARPRAPPRGLQAPQATDRP